MPMQMPTRGPQVNLIVGENGTGKSSLLLQLALGYRRARRPVISVCNTAYDRLRDVRRISRVSASQGQRLPTKVLKRALIRALEHETRLRAIPITLEYCRYGPELGLRVHGLAEQNMFELERDPAKFGVAHDDVMEISSAVALAATAREHNSPWWLDFSTSRLLDAQIDESFARLVKWETVLRKAGVLRRIELYIRRQDGRHIRLDDASSGELTLIATLVYMAVVVREDSVILIDEPENSLHPSWQKEYVTRLAELFDYQAPTIYIATHAPIIVSGALAVPDLDVRLVTVEPRAYDTASAVEQVAAIAARPPIEGPERFRLNVEGLLWTAFRTVTPSNHFVSQHVLQLLKELEDGRATIENVLREVETMQRAAYDPRQESFFQAVRTLAERVDERRPRV